MWNIFSDLKDYFQMESKVYKWLPHVLQRLVNHTTVQWVNHIENWKEICSNILKKKAKLFYIAISDMEMTFKCLFQHRNVKETYGQLSILFRLIPESWG